MVGNYAKAGSVLEFRKPVRTFAPLGWLAAGILNPAGWFAYLVWGIPEFNYQLWAWHVAVPLELGLVLAMMFLRDGGYGIGGVAGLTLICIFSACCMTGPAYTLITWSAQQIGFSVSMMGWAEIYSYDAAIAHIGTYVRLSLFLTAIAAIPAVIILRLVTFQRAPAQKPVKASPSTPPQAPPA